MAYMIVYTQPVAGVKVMLQCCREAFLIFKVDHVQTSVSDVHLICILLRDTLTYYRGKEI